MIPPTESATGVAVSSSPGLIYIFVRYLMDMPIEKWVSVVTLIFILIQIFFLLKDRFKKRRERKARE